MLPQNPSAPTWRSVQPRWSIVSAGQTNMCLEQASIMTKAQTVRSFHDSPAHPGSGARIRPDCRRLDQTAQYDLDGTLLQRWPWTGHKELDSGKHKTTTAVNVRVACTIYGKLPWISDPVDGSRHDNYCQQESGVLLTMYPKSWFGTNIHRDHMITPYRRPARGDLRDWQKEYDSQANKIRCVIEQVISHSRTAP
jgi:hypothetical protein